MLYKNFEVFFETGDVIFVLNNNKPESEQRMLFSRLQHVFKKARLMSLEEYCMCHKTLPQPAFIFYPNELLKTVLNDMKTVEEKRKLIVIDHSWLGGQSRGEYFRFCFAGCVPQAVIPQLDTEALLRPFGLNILPPIKQHSAKRKSVLITKPDPKAELFLGVDADAWVTDVCQRLSTSPSNKNVAYDLIVRDRYSKSCFKEDFDKSFAVICFNSALGVDAMRYGLPVIGTAYTPFACYTINDHNRLRGYWNQNHINISPEFLLEMHNSLSYQTMAKRALAALTQYMLPVKDFSNREKVFHLLQLIYRISVEEGM